MQQRLGQIVDRHLDEGRRTEDRRGRSRRRADPGRNASSASSTPLVTWSVLPQGNFSTISSRPGPSLMIAVADHRLMVHDDVGDVLQRAAACRRGPRSACRPGPPGSADRTCRRWAGRAGPAAAGSGCRSSRRCRCGARRRTAACPTSRASAVASMTSFERTRRASSSAPASTWTCSISMRSPQMATLATPGTCSRRCRIVQ